LTGEPEELLYFSGFYLSKQSILLSVVNFFYVKEREKNGRKITSTVVV
jgi:hypothetical protein